MSHGIPHYRESILTRGWSQMAPPNAGKLAGLIPNDFEGTLNLHLMEKDVKAGKFAGLVLSDFKGTVNLHMVEKRAKIVSQCSRRMCILRSFMLIAGISGYRFAGRHDLPDHTFHCNSIGLWLARTLLTAAIGEAGRMAPEEQARWQDWELEGGGAEGGEEPGDGEGCEEGGGWEGGEGCGEGEREGG